MVLRNCDSYNLVQSCEVAFALHPAADGWSRLTQSGRKATASNTLDGNVMRLFKPAMPQLRLVHGSPVTPHRTSPTFGASFVAAELESDSPRKFVVSRRQYTGDAC